MSKKQKSKQQVIRKTSEPIVIRVALTPEGSSDAYQQIEQQLREQLTDSRG